MMHRLAFLKAVGGVISAAAVPSPQPSSSPNPWDMCDVNNALPYNRPLALKLRVLDGPDFDLLKYRGYPTILQIFATWCEPCAYEMPHMVSAAADYAAAGLRIVGINYRESDDTVRAYRKKYGIPFPIAMDERGLFTRALEQGSAAGSVVFPVTLFITPDGYLYCYKEGSSKDPARELTYRIQKFLHDAPPKAPAVAPPVAH